MAPIPRTNGVATVTVAQQGLGIGYLAVRPGDSVTILHCGSTATSDCGWLYARRITETSEDGWLATSAVLPVRKLSSKLDPSACSKAAGPSSSVVVDKVDQALEVGAFLLARRDVAVCPGSDREDGYLAPIRLGERLEVLHVNGEGEEEGWVYVRRASNPLEAGWVLAQVVDPASVTSVPTPDLEGHENEADARHESQIPSTRFHRGDEVFHLRPGGACTVLRKQPSPEADPIDRGEPMGHNAPGDVLSVQGDWVRIKTKAGASVSGARSYEGWLLSAYLSLAELPVASETPEAARRSTPTSALRQSQSSKGGGDGTGSLPAKRKVTFVLPDSPGSSDEADS